MRRPPPPSEPRYRTIPEPRVVAMLALYGWAGDPDGEIQARAALDRLARNGLPCGRAADGTRLFDPAETINFVVHAGLEGCDPLWAERFVATGKKLCEAGNERAAAKQFRAALKLAGVAEVETDAKMASR